MRVTDDLSLGVELLWGGQVVFLRVDKGTGLQVLNGQLNCEWSMFYE